MNLFIKHQKYENANQHLTTKNGLKLCFIPWFYNKAPAKTPLNVAKMGQKCQVTMILGGRYYTRNHASLDSSPTHRSLCTSSLDPPKSMKDSLGVGKQTPTWLYAAYAIALPETVKWLKLGLGSNNMSMHISLEQGQYRYVLWLYRKMISQQLSWCFNKTPIITLHTKQKHTHDNLLKNHQQLIIHPNACSSSIGFRPCQAACVVESPTKAPYGSGNLIIKVGWLQRIPIKWTPQRFLKKFNVHSRKIRPCNRYFNKFRLHIIFDLFGVKR